MCTGAAGEAWIRSPRDAQTMATMALVALDVGTDGTNSGTDETDLVLGPSPVTEKACPNAAIVARTGLKGLAALKAAGVVDPVLVRWHAKYSVHRGRARRRIPCSFGHFDQGRPPEAAKSGLHYDRRTHQRSCAQEAAVLELTQPMRLVRRTPRFGGCRPTFECESCGLSHIGEDARPRKVSPRPIYVGGTSSVTQRVK